LKAEILAISFTLLGSLFHSLRAAEKNARSPKVSNLLRGRTNKVPSSVERRRRLGWYTVRRVLYVVWHYVHALVSRLFLKEKKSSDNTEEEKEKNNLNSKFAVESYQLNEQIIVFSTHM
jgi:hypothetical protein